MDKRQVKTKKKLSEAILALAAVKSISEITVSEISARAEINRSTFYQHAHSAADLLYSTLNAELDEVRAAHLIPFANDYQQAIAETTNAVLSHVELNAEIYRRGLGNDSVRGGLHAVLINHVSASIRILYAQESMQKFAPPGVELALAEEMSANFIAFGTVGALASWLQGPEPRKKSDFLKVFDAITPEWWPKTSA
ncbi:MAG: TetR/AcrR family transcriptional regulator [Microbacteriaceae bacterium]